MKEIAELKVLERRIFPPDIIPFRLLVTVSNLKAFKTFTFKNVEIGEDENRNLMNVEFLTGEFKHNDGIFPIDRLIITPQKIFFMIWADSNVAEKFYEAIAKLLSEMDTYGRFKENSYLLKTEQTTCIVTLDLNYRDIFSQKMNKFIDASAKECSSSIGNIAKAQIFPQSLTFNVTYLIKDKRLLNSNVEISPKKLVIEPRIGVDLKEKKFFTSSPTDSKTHLQLITEFERLFKK